MLIKTTFMLQWMLGKTRIEKIISVPIWTTSLFEGFLPSSNFGHNQEKIVMQPWENGKNPDFRPNLDPWNLFSWILPLLDVPSYHPFKFMRKLMNQTLKNDEKPNFGPNFGTNVGPHLCVYVCVCVGGGDLAQLVIVHCSKLSSSAI